MIGSELFQGDIQLTDDQQQILNGNDGHAFNVLKTSLWPHVIPYELSPEIGKKSFTEAKLQHKKTTSYICLGPTSNSALRSFQSVRR